MSGRQQRAASAHASLAWKVDTDALKELRETERTHKSSKSDVRKAAAAAKKEAMKEAKLAAVAAATIGVLEPKHYTDMATIRRLQGKYSEDQLDWCRRRLPAAMLLQGWEVLPEDAGANFSSYNEGHFMYAFTGDVAGKGGNVPYFTGTPDVFAWWEARLLARSAKAAGAPPPLPKYLRGSVRYAEGDGEEAFPVEALGLRLWRCAKSRTRTTGLQGVISKSEGLGIVFKAKHDATELGTFATAVEAAHAFAAHMAVRGATLGPADDPTSLPSVSRDAPKPKRPAQPDSLPNVAKRPKTSTKRAKRAAGGGSGRNVGFSGVPYAAGAGGGHDAVLRACGCSGGGVSAAPGAAMGVQRGAPMAAPTRAPMGASVSAPRMAPMPASMAASAGRPRGAPMAASMGLAGRVAPMAALYRLVQQPDRAAMAEPMDALMPASVGAPTVGVAVAAAMGAATAATAVGAVSPVHSEASSGSVADAALDAVHHLAFPVALAGARAGIHEAAVACGSAATACAPRAAASVPELPDWGGPAHAGASGGGGESGASRVGAAEEGGAEGGAEEDEAEGWEEGWMGDGMDGAVGGALGGLEGGAEGGAEGWVEDGAEGAFFVVAMADSDDDEDSPPGLSGSSGASPPAGI
jgi:hypothetical protein